MPSGGNHGTPPTDLGAFLQRALQSFQDQTMMESMGEDPLQEHTTKCLGEFLVASSFAMTKIQKLGRQLAKTPSRSRSSNTAKPPCI